MSQPTRHLQCDLTIMRDVSTHDARNVSMSERAARRLDAARAVLLALARAHPDAAIRGHATRAAERIVWAGSWLDIAYAPATGRTRGAPRDTESAARELHQAAEDLDELLEELEDEDPVANANGVQTSCLAFAIVGATAAYL